MLEILLVLEVQICRYQHLEPVPLCCIKELTVPQGGPAALVRRLYDMHRQRVAQRDRCALIKKYAHSSGYHCTPCRVFEDFSGLLYAYVRKPLYKL